MNITPINNQNQQSFGIKGFKFKNKATEKAFRELIPFDEFKNVKAEINALKPSIGKDIRPKVSYSEAPEPLLSQRESRAKCFEFKSKDGLFGQIITATLNKDINFWPRGNEFDNMSGNELLNSLKKLIQEINYSRSLKNLGNETKLLSDKGLPSPMPKAPELNSNSHKGGPPNYQP